MNNVCVKVVVDDKKLVKRNELGRKFRYYKYHINSVKFRKSVGQYIDRHNGVGCVCKELYVPIYIACILHRSYIVIRENNNNYDY